MSIYKILKKKLDPKYKLGNSIWGNDKSGSQREGFL